MNDSISGARVLGEIDELDRRVSAQRALSIRLAAPAVIEGKSVGGVTVFGTLKTARDAAVIVAFDGAAADIMFGGVKVAGGTSPVFAVINGTGNLALSAVRGNARALIIGADKT